MQMENGSFFGVSFRPLFAGSGSGSGSGGLQYSQWLFLSLYLGAFADGQAWSGANFF